jgi:serine protease DegS/serine protease DegQ
MAGIQQRDVLLKIGAEDILDPSDLRRHEASLKPGAAIEISGLRNGAAFTSTITPSQRPPTAPMQALQQGGAR